MKVWDLSSARTNLNEPKEEANNESRCETTLSQDGNAKQNEIDIYAKKKIQEKLTHIVIQRNIHIYENNAKEIYIFCNAYGDANISIAYTMYIMRQANLRVTTMNAN